MQSKATNSKEHHDPTFCPISTEIRGDMRRNIFVTPLNIEKNKSKVTTNSLSKNEQILLYWHRFFGHASLTKIRQVFQEKLCASLPTSLPKGEIKCDICARSKSINKNRLSPSDRPVEKLDIITADIIGPFEVETFNKGKYLLTIRDLATGFSEAKVMAEKSQACGYLIETILRWEKQLSGNVKCVRTDNGGEFCSDVLSNFLLTKGIKAERALPYHHYQNGVIERFNRTLADMGCTILIDSRMGKPFWGFTFIWACDVLNALPNKRSGMMTPYEVFYGHKPSMDRYRIFGERAFIHVPEELRKKLDDRGLEARVVAHCDDSKGWIFLLVDTNQLVGAAVVDWPDRKTTNPRKPEPIITQKQIANGQPKGKHQKNKPTEKTSPSTNTTMPDTINSP
jgi:hypothetical protein